MSNFLKVLFSSLCLISCVFGDLEKDLAYDRDYFYQDLLVNGETIWKGQGPDCLPRYEVLRPLLDSFKRPFTVLEVGANNGYFSIKIAEDYGATCVMVDGTDRLKKICELNSKRGNFIYLKKYITAEELELLAKKEHFDVVIAFHVLHHQGKNWKRFANALLKLGDNVVIETPPASDSVSNLLPTVRDIAPYLLSLSSGEQIGSFLRQTSDVYDHMLLFKNPSSSRRHATISKKSFDKLGGVYSNVPLR